MDKSEYLRFKLDFIVKTYVQEQQFYQWLRKFFNLSQELNREYNFFYQDSFYIVFYELITEGLEYSKKFLSDLERSNKPKTKKQETKIEWYRELIKGLIEIKDNFSIEEIEYIRYKRHNAAHIFQNHYENKVFETGKIEKAERLARLRKLDSDFKKLLLKHGGDKEFDLYMGQKIHPIAIELYNRLENL